MAEKERDDESAERGPAGEVSANNGGLDRQRSTASSIWAAETMSFPREVVFVALVCMAQFCTREFAKTSSETFVSVPY